MVHWVSGAGQSLYVRHLFSPMTHTLTGGSFSAPLSTPFSQWSYQRMMSSCISWKGRSMWAGPLNSSRFFGEFWALMNQCCAPCQCIL